MRAAILALATTAVALAAATPLPAPAQSVTIYRCTDANGAITVQNDRPCPKGSTQSKRVMEGVPTAPPPSTLRRIVPGTPAPAAAPAPAPPRAAAPAVAPATPAVIVAAPRAAPPALFECKSFDGTLSLSESGDPTERCASLSTTGINGDPTLGAGQACEMRADDCTKIAEADLCTRWQQRLRDAQGAERFGNDAGRAAAQLEITRAQQVLSKSTCVVE